MFPPDDRTIAEHPITAPEDLVHHSLIHFEWQNYDSNPPNWKNWLTLAGLNAIDPNRGLTFDDGSLAIQAAIAGQGVALCSSVHVFDDVRMGFLAKPLDLSLPGLTYSAVYLKKHPKEPLILKFVDWLIEQAQAFN